MATRSTLSSATSLGRARFATPRDPSRRTLGGAVGTMARALGYEPMPWQCEAWDVAGEVVPADNTLGYRFAYPVVVWIVPRRAGKTLGVLANTAQRLTTRKLYRARYTAQTRQDAARTFRDEWAPAVHASPAASRLFRVRLSNGDEQLRLPRLGSAMSLFSPRESSLHGQPSDMGVVDEAWAFDEVQGDAIEAALRPTFKTRPAPQLWIVSAAGNPRSTWLKRWVDLGRAGTPGIAYLEFSADPDVDDLDDPRTLELRHPAVGHTIRAEDLVADRPTMSRAEWLRAYLGVWPSADEGAAWDVVPEGPYRACTLDDLDLAAIRADAPDPDAIAVAVAPDGAAACLSVAYRWHDRVVVEVVRHEAGVAWVVDAARVAQDVHRLPITADPMGPAGPTVDKLGEAGVFVDPITTDRLARSCAAWVDDLVGGTLAHLGQPLLESHARRVTRRPMGERWAWRREGDVTALESAALAASVARVAGGRPVIVSR